MITIKEKVDWLQQTINKNKKSIQAWHLMSYRTNICDNMGVNPIDKLLREIKIAQELIYMLAEDDT